MSKQIPQEMSQQIYADTGESQVAEYAYRNVKQIPQEMLQQIYADTSVSQRGTQMH